MSAGTKHGRDEEESQSVRLSKKSKTDGESVNRVKEGKKSKDKKDKKDKKEKKEKREKKDKKEKKEKDKKEKKEKKDKKEKKEKKTEETAEETAEEKGELPEDNGLSGIAETLKATDTADLEPEGERNKKDKSKEKKEKKEKKQKSKASELDCIQEPRLSTNPSYTQSAALEAVPETEIQAFLAEHQIIVSDPSPSAAPFRPVVRFDLLPTSKLLSKKPFVSFSTPTPIQAASWPFALSGRDVVGVAETGSGKTYAFAIPCIEALLASAAPSKKSSRSTQPRAVIVSPTRELAMQTHAAVSGLAALVGLSAVCVYGGSNKDDQRTALRCNGGADVVVATPGRLKDFMSDDTVALGRAGFVVLDEADRMLDKGFEDDIRLILGACPPRERRQTLMFTATWPASVRSLAEGFMVDPVKITIGRGPGGGVGEDGEDGSDSGGGGVELQANSRITQKVEVVDPRSKEQRLSQLLQEAQKGAGKKDRILVFCLYKKEAVRVEQTLQRKGIRVASIHGDLRQEQRTRSLEAFKAGTTTVLVATDVAARGLDIPEVKLVINVTFPLTIEDYVHRIGRTGRAGKQGNAITLFTEHDKAHSGSLINILKGANQPVPPELLKFGTTVKRKSHDTYGAFFKDVDMNKKGTKITFD